MKKIGVIYCPVRRWFCSTKKRWRQMAASLDKYGVAYDMVQSEERQSVERLVTMMIANGYETIVVAGGDAALNDAVNCLMKLEKQHRAKINLGVIPNGSINDFASYWGFASDKLDLCARSIALGKTRKIDVGCLRYNNRRGERKQRYFLDCVDVGLLASIQRLRQNVRRMLFSRKLSYAISLLLMLFQKMEFKVQFKINDTNETHRITTICIGNATGFGQTPGATPYNGMLDVTVVRSIFLLQYITGIWLFLRGRLLNHKRVRPYRTERIEIESGHSIPVSVDGHPIESPVGRFYADIEAEEVNFIIE